MKKERILGIALILFSLIIGSGAIITGLDTLSLINSSLKINGRVKENVQMTCTKSTKQGNNKYTCYKPVLLLTVDGKEMEATLERHNPSLWVINSVVPVYVNKTDHANIEPADELIWFAPGVFVFASLLFFIPGLIFLIRSFKSPLHEKLTLNL